MFKIQKVGNIYTKYMMRIINNELVLIQWNPKVRTTIHNHGGKDCDFYLLGGTLNEVKYKNQNIGSLTTSQRITSFRKNTVKKSEYHQIFNFDNKKKWSFHRYY